VGVWDEYEDVGGRARGVCHCCVGSDFWVVGALDEGAWSDEVDILRAGVVIYWRNGELELWLFAWMVARGWVSCLRVAWEKSFVVFMESRGGGYYQVLCGVLPGFVRRCDVRSCFMLGACSEVLENSVTSEYRLHSEHKTPVSKHDNARQIRYTVEYVGTFLFSPNTIVLNLMPSRTSVYDNARIISKPQNLPRSSKIRANIFAHSFEDEHSLLNRYGVQARSEQTGLLKEFSLSL
jgi:hypothetical protein